MKLDSIIRLYSIRFQLKALEFLCSHTLMFISPVHLIITPVTVTNITSGKTSIGITSSIPATILTVLSYTLSSTFW